MGEPVIVVGAGAGGLAAAWRLKLAGHQVRILEAGPKVGGRIQSTRHHGHVVDRAASIVPDAYANILGIVAEAGLTDELVPGGSVIGFAKPGGIHYLDSARLYSSAARTRLLSPRSKLMMLRLLRDARRLDPLMSYEDLSVAAAYDTETAEQYAARRLTPEISEYVIDGAIRAILGTRAKDVSVLEFFISFAKVPQAGTLSSPCVGLVHDLRGVGVVSSRCSGRRRPCGHRWPGCPGRSWRSCSERRR